MKFRVDPKDLADAVNAAAKALPSRPSVPVLAGVMLRLVGTELQVSSFDYEVSTRTTVGVALGGEDGAALVSGRLLAEITKALPNKPIDIASVGAHVELVCGSARFTLPTMPVEDYPMLPEMPEAAGTIGATAFAAAVAQVAVAAGRDETLPMMTGVRIELNGSTMAMLATDRYRLAVWEGTWTPDAANIDLQALVPGRTLSETAKTLGAAGGDVTIALASGGLGEGIIGFHGAGRETTSRLLDGANYPPVRSLFPATHNAEATVAVSALVEVVKRVALVAERSTPVLLSFSPDGLIVEAGGSEEARASEAMDATFTGEPLTIGFNPQYLIDGLQACNSAVAKLAFVDAFKPAVVHPCSADGEILPGYRYLIMPIRVTR